ncbi:hypothetical protein [Nocardia sp. NPDC005825]|uniref:hypothetical protein n=1 Tax=unclassified Nocardia TaxID=2637762 RepID=UPI0033EE8765
MTIEDILALLHEGDHVGWVCYQDGSWALLGSDGWAGPVITPSDMLAAVGRDLDGLEESGLITEVIDAEPLSVIDLDSNDRRPGPASEDATADGW